MPHRTVWRFIYTLACLVSLSGILVWNANAQSFPSPIDSISPSAPWSRRIADSFLLRHPGAVTYDTGFTEQKWNYEQGLILWALHRMSVYTSEQRYSQFLVKNLDQYVDSSGRIATYHLTDYNLDLVAPGRALLIAYEQTHQDKFRFAADTLRRQLREQPRTHEGGFWHKKIYPYQMWLDGLYMAEPFYAKYAGLNHEPEAFDDIADQFIFIARHTRDARTGLYYHGWDESKAQQWSNKTTGCSPSFWGRAMGWYAMGLVDVLDYMPARHAKRSQLVKILRDVCASLLKWRDKESSLWYLVVDQGPRPGNYLESSSSAMYIYAMAKGANKGYLDKRYILEAGRSFKAMLTRQVTVNDHGFVDLHFTVKGAGLGGKPYRDGTFEYYVSERQRTNDMKGIGPLILAAIELHQ